MARQLSRLQASLLGIVVLAGLAIGVAGLAAIQSRRGFGGDSFTVQVDFPDIGGVEVGARVYLQGIDAGEVESIVAPARPGENVRLELRVKGSLHHLIGTDARAQIAPENLIAGKIVRILPGKAGADLVTDGGELAASPNVELSDTLASAATKLNRVLSETDDFLSELHSGKGLAVARDLTQASQRLNTILGRIDSTLEGIEKGEGTFGQLVKNKDMYLETMQSLQDMRRMVASVKQNADAIKSLPVISSYVVDAQKELNRPDCKTYRVWFPEDKLFEPGRAILTAEGRKQLDAQAGWLNENRGPKSDVVIAAFAAPGRDADLAQTLTQKQADAVMDYLKKVHQIHRIGWWLWSTRPVHAVGAGSNPPVLPETQSLPLARVELLVFVPGT